MWFDPRKLADPSFHPARIIEIIWLIYCLRLAMVISITPLRITYFPQSAIKEFIERQLKRVVIMTTLCR
jgi:hypothetical protein